MLRSKMYAHVYKNIQKLFQGCKKKWYYERSNLCKEHLSLSLSYFFVVSLDYGNYESE